MSIDKEVLAQQLEKTLRERQDKEGDLAMEAGDHTLGFAHFMNSWEAFYERMRLSAAQHGVQLPPMDDDGNIPGLCDNDE